jgi:hypothetical protein
VVYFTKDTHSGVCVFRRRRTTEQGHRGFRLTSLGVLLAKSTRSRPWRHVAALRALADSIYLSLETRGVLEPCESDWEPARVFFEERKVRRADLSGAGEWYGWSHELDNPDSELSRFNPTMHPLTPVAHPRTFGIDIIQACPRASEDTYIYTPAC